ncbi:MAG TPA: efflux RND transporter periplasmic adaptor subunit, partial [Gemmatimonadaceae bacterium]|nr:efflux RND transporter periplasmic adaptor subunit [Gemmatimonadaceae bacterium]
MTTMRHTFLLIACTISAACSRPDARIIEATGTLEYVEIGVAPTMPARVQRVLVQEGAVVRAGDTLVVLAIPSLPFDVAQRAARAAAAGAALREARSGSRAGEIARAEAEVAAAVADADRASKDADRLRGLAERNIVSAQQYDAAHALAVSTAAHRDALRASLALLREGTRPERIQAARADALAARASLEGARAAERDLVLLAPVSGSITNRAAEPGEVIGAGQAALKLAETRRQTVRVYVSQAALSRVQAGQPVRGVLDAFPNREFQGRVVALSTAAEFTP